MGQALAEWRHGWKVVLAALVGMSISTFPAYTHGVFAPEIGREFGWSRLQLSAAVMLPAFAGALFAPMVGKAADKFGTRRVAISGLVLALFGYGQLGFTIGSSYQGLLLSWLVAAVCHAPANAMIWTVGVARSFNRNRGLALAVALCGTGLMGGLQSISARLLVDEFGWRTSYKLMAAGTVGLSLLVALFFFRVIESGTAGKTRLAGAAVTGLTFSEACRIRQFWMLALLLLLTGGPLTGMLVSVIQLHQERGLSPMVAASLLSVTATTAIVARLATGALLDRLHGAFLASATFASAAIAMGVLLFFPGNLTAGIIAAMMFGLAVGAEIDLISYLASRYFGLRHFATIYGALFAIFAVAQGIAPMLISWSADVTGGYDVALTVVAGLYAAGAMLSLSLGPYPKIFDPRAMH